MSLNESNSTKLVLAPNAVFQGKAVRPDVKYITIQITATFTGGNSGLLEIYYSLDGIYYDTFGDSWTYTTETNEVHVFKETQMKGSFFYVKWTNNGISEYTSFNLTTKLAETTSSVSVNGVINIPTVTVDIEGQTIFSKIRDTAGNALNSTDGRLNVDISGQNVIVPHLNKTLDSVDISGQRVDISGQSIIIPRLNKTLDSVDISGQRVDISGQTIDISGQSVVVPHLNKTTDSVDISGQRVDISGQSIIIPRLNKTTDSIDISGQRVDISGQTLFVNTISGFATSVLQTAGNNLLTDIKNKTLDSNADSVTVYAGGENGLNIRYLSSVNDNVDVGLSTYAYSNSNPPFPATRDVLSTQLCGVNNLAGDNLINLVSNSDGSLKVDISGQTIDISGQNIIVPHLNKTTDSVDISGQRVDISGQTVDISGQSVVVPHLNKTLDSVDISGQRVDISGQTLVVNTISGFATSALQTAGNTSLSDIKTNSDKLKYVGDDLKTVISNTTFDSKLRDGNNNIITSTIYGIDGVRGLDVSIKNATQAEPLNVAIDATNVLTCAVNNFPAEYSISAGGALSSATGALNVNLRNTAGDAVGISSAPLIVESNLITGFALETGGNLAGVKTNTDKFKFNGDNLKTEIMNTALTVQTATNSLDVNITGGTLTGANGKAYLYSGDEATSITATTVSGKNGIDSNIINSSIDTHCYGSSNGTNWHHLATDGNGQLNVHSKLQDGAGTDLTSTLNGAKQSLDVNVANIGSLKVDISGSTILEGKIAVFDGLSFPYIERISVGAGADINAFTFGNFYNNVTINAGAYSTPGNFAAGSYGRRAMLFYRDSATSSTDSISFYTNSNFGTSTPLFMATTYPIVNGGYRWSTIILNILPFSNLYIRNDSTTINNTGVYLTMIGV